MKDLIKRFVTLLVVLGCAFSQVDYLERASFFLVWLILVVNIVAWFTPKETLYKTHNKPVYKEGHLILTLLSSVAFAGAGWFVTAASFFLVAVISQARKVQYFKDKDNANED